MSWVRFTADGHTAYGSLTGDTITEIAGEPWGATANRQDACLADVKLEVPVIPKTFYAAASTTRRISARWRKSAA